MNIEQKIITPVGYARSGEKLQPGVRWIIIHETDNTSTGAGADNHYIYYNRLNKQGPGKKSCHFVVDSKKIIQLLPLDEIGWNNTDKRTPYNANPPKGGNMAGLSIEMCVNRDGNFEKTLQNTIWLVAHLLDRFKLTINEVKQHNDFYPKNCPRTLRETGRWGWFLQQVQAKYNEMKGIKPAPSSPGTIAVGSTVTVNGRLYATSAGAGPGKTLSNYTGKVSIIKPGAKYPYHIATPSGGALGWVSAGSIGASAPPSQPSQPAPPSLGTIAVGSTVTVNGRLYATSAGAGPGKTLSNYTGKVSIIKPGAKYPYHIATPSGGALGWVSAESIGASAPPSQPSQPAPPSPGTIAVGSTVTVNGRLYATSAGAGPGKTLSNYTGKVSIIKPGAKYPYHIATPSGGALGWVSAESIGASAPPSQPSQPAPPSSGTIAVGSTVTVNGRLYATSAGAGPGKTLSNYTGKISIIKPGAKYPYHIVTPSGGALGWVSAKSVK